MNLFYNKKKYVEDFVGVGIMNKRCEYYGRGVAVKKSVTRKKSNILFFGIQRDIFYLNKKMFGMKLIDGKWYMILWKLIRGRKGKMIDKTEISLKTMKLALKTSIEKVGKDILFLKGEKLC